jgi:hypothetical protein
MKELEPRTLLALDASTKEIGYTIWNVDTKELVSMNHFTHNTNHTLLEKAQAFELLVKMLVDLHPTLSEMVIEESFQAMYGGASSAHTTAVLNQVNALYQYICYKSGLKVTTLSVSECRRLAFPGIKIKSLATLMKAKEKDVVFGLVRKELGEERFPTKTISKGKNKGKVVFEDYAADMADAYVVGKAYLAKL